MNRFKDKVAIVTGGASGIGKELCLELGRRGAVVVVTDINMAGAQEVASAIVQAGGQAEAAQLDVTQAEAVQRLIDDTDSQHGHLDYMFNNAGATLAGEVRDMSPEHWQQIVNVNLWGVIHGTTGAYSVMVRQGHGHIVNTASPAGLLPSAGSTAYSTTKHGVVGLSTSLRAEGADLGVKVSVICPGYVRTAIYDTMPVLNADRDEALALLKMRQVSQTKAARLIIRGVERNRAIVVFPIDMRFAWWLYRLRPSIIEFFGRKLIRQFRDIRIEP